MLSLTVVACSELTRRIAFPTKRIRVPFKLQVKETSEINPVSLQISPLKMKDLPVHSLHPINLSADRKRCFLLWSRSSVSVWLWHRKRLYKLQNAILHTNISAEHYSITCGKNLEDPGILIQCLLSKHHANTWKQTGFTHWPRHHLHTGPFTQARQSVQVLFVEPL